MSFPAACVSVGLARALAINPDILLMDEAFSALDPLIRTEMQDELVKLQARHQRTIVFISHDLDEAMRIGDRIAIMQNGEVVQVGTPDEILNNPANDYVRTFFRGVDINRCLAPKILPVVPRTALFVKRRVSDRALPLSCRTKTVNTVIWLNAAINLSALSPSILSKPRSAKTGELMRR